LVWAAHSGAPPGPYPLRVTTVFRREDGEWRIVQRHGDSLKPRVGNVLVQQLQASDR
jgi:ketosteroid isomerase-like protein